MTSNEAAQRGIQVFIAGDSTAANYPPEHSPMAGWGQRLGELFQPSITVVNAARNGRSSKSFIEEGLLEQIEQGIEPGDYFLIQFGHNDQKPDEERHTEPDTTYPQQLSRHIELARSKGAHPILLTSVERRHFGPSGELIPSHGEYPAAVMRLADQLQVPVLDLCARTQSAYRAMGAEDSKAWFVWLKPEEHANYPEGLEDNTHFNETGALEVAKLVAEELKQAGIPLAQWLL
ncbi:rhamnogalacturonan acetylesterase [Paenibacillus cremeus]|uniref:Rhamnogalacturonan acetylesterase n=1 Tax=Paenibacillus cremeus TaxID=2163881 RepID=A0A559K4S4_9BACL|nr:rhamnogalacturonan acetylesterase [Paenibacillus cremeus]TVY07083.1 rhamnogalacturonan acetylesterase [Paenibacillus cremeus]